MIEIPNPSTVRSTKRRAELAAIAQKYGFKSWSAMLTAIKNGDYDVTPSAATLAKSYIKDGADFMIFGISPAPAGTINGR